MAARGFLFAGTKHSLNMVDKTDGDLQQTFIVRGSLEGDCGLNEMTCAIELVTEIEVSPFPLWFYDLIVTVQITIRLLRRSDEGNHLICQSLQFMIWRASEFPSQRFQPFIDVLIRKIHAAIITRFQASCHLKIMKITSVVQHGIAML